MSTCTFAVRAATAAAALSLFIAAPPCANSALAQGQTRAAQPAGAVLPAPKIIVVDRSAILRASKVGQDIVRQVNGFTQSAESEFRAEQANLQKEGQALQQQVAILAPDVRAQKVNAFETKQASFRKRVEARQSQIQGGVLRARQQVEQALGPILQGIMQERGANLLLDRSAVVLGMVDVDVTALTIQRLDQKLPTVKVQLANPPANALPAR